MNLSHHHHRAGRRGPIRRGPHGEPGYVLVTFALMLVPLMLIAGLSIDVGSWYSRASDIQKAADAAALAGVVWLPDEDLAEQFALEAAARNGFVHGGDITITVAPVGDRRLRVTIEDAKVGSFIGGNFGVDDIALQRQGTAEYVLPVPLGSPRNFFGTGPLPSGYNENLWLSVNTWCTDKVDGDRYQSPFDGNRPYSTNATRCPSTHTGSFANPEYRPGGYEYYVEVPANRTGNIEVLLFDARYNTSTHASTPASSLANCTVSYANNWTAPTGATNQVRAVGQIQYQTRTTDTGSWNGSTSNLSAGATNDQNWRRVRYRRNADSAWTAPPNSTSNSNVTITGPAEYQTRSSTNGSWSGTTTLADGATVNRAWNLIRYRLGHQTCVDRGVDISLYNGAQDYTFRLYAADSTPLSDADNPLVPGCSQTFSANTAFTSGINFLGSTRWNRLCTITTSMPTGRYILRVTNNAGERYGAGANNFALVAKYTSAAYTASALCDSRTVSTCPRVFGKDAISVFANEEASTADFFLAEIEPLHVGKKLQVELYDPGEGGNNIRLRRPTGTNTWSDATFTWTSTNPSHPGGGPTTTLDVTGDRFNGHTVQLIIDLAGYNPPTNNRWWQVRYNFGSGTVTDRTTWSAKVIGDPVHLIEED